MASEATRYETYVRTLARANKRAGGRRDGSRQESRGAIVPMPKDGSCLFHAALHGLRALPAPPVDPTTTALSVRRVVVDWLAANLERPFRTFEDETDDGHDAGPSPTIADAIRDEGERDVGDYLRRMRHPATWGGAPELLALSRVYGVDLRVVARHRPLELARFAPSASAVAPKVRVVFDGRGHYDAFVPHRTP